MVYAGPLWALPPPAQVASLLDASLTPSSPTVQALCRTSRKFAVLHTLLPLCAADTAVWFFSQRERESVWNLNRVYLALRLADVPLADRWHK